VESYFPHPAELRDQRAWPRTCQVQVCYQQTQLCRLRYLHFYTLAEIMQHAHGYISVQASLYLFNIY